MHANKYTTFDELHEKGLGLTIVVIHNNKVDGVVFIKLQIRKFLYYT